MYKCKYCGEEFGWMNAMKGPTYGKTIIAFPDQSDPVKLIDEKMLTCPFCNRVVSDDSTDYEMFEIEVKEDSNEL